MTGFGKWAWFVGWIAVSAPALAVGGSHAKVEPPELVTEGATKSAQGAAPASTPAKASVQGTREVIIDEKLDGHNKVVGVFTAKSLLTTVEFPEDLTQKPLCGDCEFEPGPEGDALYKLTWSPQGRYLTLRPNPNARRQKEGGEKGSNVFVKLEHASLTLFVLQTDRGQADTRVVVTYPNRAAENEYLRVERAKMEAEAAGRVETMFRGRMLKAMQEPHACVEKSARTRNQDIVLEVKEMCYFGRDVFIVFKVENRGHEPLEVGSVVVSRGENARDDLGGGRVEGDEPSIGAVAVHLADTDPVKGPYELTVQEKGGKERVISIGRLEF